MSSKEKNSVRNINSISKKKTIDRIVKKGGADIDITTILNTCCRNNTPDDTIIINNIKNIKKYNSSLLENLIIVFDGKEIKNPEIHPKCKGSCDILKYDIYIKNVKKKTKEILPTSNIKFIVMPERSCLTTSLKKGIQMCETKFLHTVQEDLSLKKTFDLKSVIDTIQNDPRVDLIRLNTGENKQHNEYTIKRCRKIRKIDISSFNPETIKVNGLTLSRSNQYSDQNHITTKEFYEKYVFPNVKEGDFMEHFIMCEATGLFPGKDKLPDTLWHLGDYDDGYTNHKNGRRA